MLNEFFQSLFSPKILIDIKKIKPENPKMTHFSVSKTSQQNILLTLDPKKAGGPDGLHQCSIRKLTKYLTKYPTA